MFEASEDRDEKFFEKVKKEQITVHAEEEMVGWLQQKIEQEDTKKMRDRNNCRSLKKTLSSNEAQRDTPMHMNSVEENASSWNPTAQSVVNGVSGESELKRNQEVAKEGSQNIRQTELASESRSDAPQADIFGDEEPDTFSITGLERMMKALADLMQWTIEASDDLRRV
jgi:hypothetical protein